MGNYEAFKEMLIDALEDGAAGEAYTKVKEVKVAKNNLYLDGITFDVDGGIAPTVYPERILEEINSGEPDLSIEEMVRKAVLNLREVLPAQSLVTTAAADITAIVTDWNKVKDLVQIRMVGSELNPILEGRVYIEPAQGVAAIFFIPFEGFMGDGMASTVVSDDMFEAWGISFDTLYAAAMANTSKEAQIISMSEILKEMMPPEMVAFMPEPEEDPMLVISNKHRVNGNGGVLCSEVMSRCAERLGSDKLVILPSSIHESIVVAVPEGFSPKDLQKMVAEVNCTNVTPDERVCDMAYLYDTATGAFAPATVAAVAY